MPGILTLTFDDGYRHVYKKIVPLLDSMGMVGVFAVPIDETAVATSEHLPTTSWQEWVKLRDQGHEIAAHSISHTDLTSLTAAQLDQELTEPAQKLDARTLVYPGGAYNDTVIGAATRKYQAARTTDFGMESVPAEDSMRLKTVNYTDCNWSLFRANLRVLWASIRGRWLIETYHVIDDTSDAIHAVPYAQFVKHIEFIKRVGISVRTIKSVVS